MVSFEKFSRYQAVIDYKLSRSHQVAQMLKKKNKSKVIVASAIRE